MGAYKSCFTNSNDYYIVRILYKYFLPIAKCKFAVNINIFRVFRHCTNSNNNNNILLYMSVFRPVFIYLFVLLIHFYYISIYLFICLFIYILLYCCRYFLWGSFPKAVQYQIKIYITKNYQLKTMKSSNNTFIYIYIYILVNNNNNIYIYILNISR
eukprot:gene8529-5976_t